MFVTIIAEDIPGLKSASTMGIVSEISRRRRCIHSLVDMSESFGVHDSVTILVCCDHHEREIVVTSDDKSHDGGQSSILMNVDESIAVRLGLLFWGYSTYSVHVHFYLQYQQQTKVNHS